MNTSTTASWAKFDQKISENLVVAAKSSYFNGCNMLDDARLLYENKRYPRSLALSILAEEEMAKAFFLLSSKNINRWDSEIYKALKIHQKKHTFSISISHLIESIFSHIHGMQFSSFFYPQFDVQRAVEKIVPENSKYCEKKEVVEKLKQRSLYVSLTKDASVKSTPENISEKEVVECFNRANKLKLLLNNFPSPLNDGVCIETFPGGTTLNYERSSRFTIKYKNGIVVVIDIFDLIPTMNLQDCKFLNLNNAVKNFFNQHWYSLNPEEILDICRVIKYFKVIDQIINEWNRLGFVGKAPLLEQCIALVEKHHV